MVEEAERKLAEKNGWLYQGWNSLLEPQAAGSKLKSRQAVDSSGSVEQCYAEGEVFCNCWRRCGYERNWRTVVNLRRRLKPTRFLGASLSPSTHVTWRFNMNFLRCCLEMWWIGI